MYPALPPGSASFRVNPGGISKNRPHFRTAENGGSALLLYAIAEWNAGRRHGCKLAQNRFGNVRLTMTDMTSAKRIHGTQTL